MPEPIIVNTAYTFAQYREFIISFRKPTRKKTLFILLVYIFIAVLFHVLSPGPSLLRLFVISLCYFIIFLYLTLFLNSFGLLSSEKSFNNPRKNVHTSATITFHKDFIEELETGEGFSTKTSLNYELVEKITESENLLFIYQNSSCALFVDKNGFQQGDLNSLRLFLQSKIDPAKFIN